MYTSMKLLNKTYYKLNNDSTMYVKSDYTLPKWKFTFSKWKNNNYYTRYNSLKFGNFTFQIYTPFFIFRKTEGSIDVSIKLPYNKIIVEEHLVGEIKVDSDWRMTWFSAIGAGSKHQYFTKQGRLMTNGFTCK